jgi:RNA polymerase sigma-70 factor (ECF subfamily)
VASRGTRDVGASDRAEIEREVRRLCEGGAFVAATAAAIRVYGPEILGFLIAQHHSAGDADEVFSLWSEHLFRGLPRFGWGCSLRTWAYTLAHNASISFARGRRARARRERAAGSQEIAAVEQQVRTETPAHQRTEAKSKLAAIRDALPPEDRMLLVLRVDKRLEWKDLARVMLGEDGDVTEAAIAKESQRLRKRFQLLKEKLVEAGKRAGILGDGERS